MKLSLVRQRVEIAAAFIAQRGLDEGIIGEPRGAYSYEAHSAAIVIEDGRVALFGIDVDVGAEGGGPSVAKWSWRSLFGRELRVVAPRDPKRRTTTTDGKILLGLGLIARRAVDGMPGHAAAFIRGRRVIFSERFCWIGPARIWAVRAFEEPF